MSQCQNQSVKRLIKAKVLSHQVIRPCYNRLSLKLESEFSATFGSARPGQFLEMNVSHLAVPDLSMIPAHLNDSAQRHILLRRPFSFSDVRNLNDYVELDILYCVLGPATIRMTMLSPGDQLSVIGPLGNGFSIPSGKKTALLIAGGMGAPPLQHLAKVLRTSNLIGKVVAFAGARSLEDLPFEVDLARKGHELREFSDLNIPSRIATDDGSVGYKGYITSCLQDWFGANPIEPSETVMYACGPEPMLHVVAKLARHMNIDCQISLERMMACGIGLCQSCAVKMSNPEAEDGWAYRLCCTDGPVFDAKDVIFD